MQTLAMPGPGSPPSPEVLLGLSSLGSNAIGMLARISRKLSIAQWAGRIPSGRVGGGDLAASVLDVERRLGEAADC